MLKESIETEWLMQLLLAKTCPWVLDRSTVSRLGFLYLALLVVETDIQRIRLSRSEFKKDMAYKTFLIARCMDVTARSRFAGASR